jgi:hypothetical protein
MGTVDAGFRVAVPRLGIALDGSACAAGLCDEVDLHATPRDVSAWGAVGGESPTATVAAQEELMYVALTNLISFGVDSSLVATIPDVVCSEDALWIAWSILLLTLRGSLPEARSNSTSPTTGAGTRRQRPPLVCSCT